MKFIHKLALLALAGLLVAPLLAACGESIQTEDSNFTKGNEYIKAGEFEKAITEFEAVIAKEPEQVSALTNLGVACYNVGRLDDAIATYQKAIGIAPNDADIHSNLAAAYVQKQEFDQALAEYKKAVELNPKLSQAHFGLGVVYLSMGKNDEARQAFLDFQTYDDGSDSMATQEAAKYLEQLKAP